MFALEFSADVDPTALPTVLLALPTFATVVVGGLTLRGTRSEIYLSRREVEVAHRPVLIPVLEEAWELQESGKVKTYRAKPQYEPDRVVVPIKNIGLGPALNISVNVALLDDAGEVTQAPGDRKYQGTVVSLGVSEIAAADVFVPVDHLPD